ncbi:hypothetical protein pb186bvf_006964 [Paramecium bursaria]
MQKKRQNNHKFLKTAHQLVQNQIGNEIIGWNKNGTKIVIRNRRLFVSDILPQYFKHSNYTSFLRQSFNMIRAIEQIWFQGFTKNKLQLDLFAFKQTIKCDEFFQINEAIQELLENQRIIQKQLKYIKTIQVLLEKRAHVMQQIIDIDFVDKFNEAIKLEKFILDFYRGIIPGPFQKFMQNLLQQHIDSSCTSTPQRFASISDFFIEEQLYLLNPELKSNILNQDDSCQQYSKST